MSYRTISLWKDGVETWYEVLNNILDEEGKSVRLVHLWSNKLYRTSSVIQPSKTKSAVDIAKTKADHKIELLKRKGWSTEKDAVSVVYNPMLLHNFNKHEKKITYPCIVQPKLDGLRCLWNPQTEKLMTRGGKEFNLEHIRNQIKKLQEHLGTTFFLDGELYVPGKYLQEVSSLISDGDLSVSYYIFDIPQFNTPYIGRLKQLYSYRNAISAYIHLEVVQSEAVSSREELVSRYDKLVSDGFEGVVIKNLNGIYEFNKRSYDIQKYKPLFDEEFLIKDTKADLSIPGKELVKFVCATKNGKNFEVVPSWTQEQRDMPVNERMKFIGKYLTVEYRGLTVDGIPQHAIGKTIREDLS